MKSFAHGKLANFAIQNGLAKALEEADTGHGAEIILTNTEPKLLSRLLETAIISSSVASCAIENITAPNFENLVLTPKPIEQYTRDERHLANYKRALEFIYTTPASNLQIQPDFIRHLHSLVMADSAEAGEYKGRDNLIIEERKEGAFLRFKPVSARETPHYLEQLCLYYNNTLQKEECPTLLATAAFILDFTAIHPFHDGNGRVSRVLTAAALLAQGFQMPKYVSLEEIIEEDREDYYRALELSSENWHQGTHNLESFLTFQTRVIAKGYRDFSRLRERSDLTLTVAFHEERLSQALRTAIEKELLIHYPNATFKITKDGVKDAQIEGFKSDLPKEEWDPLHRADRLVRYLVARARNREARRPESSPKE